METLLDTQKVLVETLNGYIESTERKLDKIKKLQSSLIHVQNASSGNFQEFVSNPINAFVLIKKFTVDWDEARTVMSCQPSNEIAAGNVVFPDQDDLSGAAKALLRVQQTYSLETDYLSEGKILGAANGLPLSADDCFELGRQAFHAGFYDSAISWLELSQQKQFENGSDIRNSSEILTYLAMSEYQLDRIYKNLNRLERNSLERESEFMHLASSLLQLGFMSVAKPDNPLGGFLEKAVSQNIFVGHTNIFDEATYRKLCQSSMQALSASYSSNLKCHLQSHHPYLLLQPVKEEQLWDEPKISLFYDIISDREINIMKSLALPALKRAEVAEYNAGLGHRVSDTRVTKIAWLREMDHPLIPKMYHRIEAITGLSSSSAEPFQMANYGLGGHFHLHMDVLPDTETYFGPEMGNRVATWLTYLSDVSGGGATVFPRLNITVWPKKGSALFWHNVKSNGIGDILTLHGACPVVTGSKWVTNVWFHERGQEFRLKCGIHPESSLLPTHAFEKS
ncbi:Prolyl 4-hydroxylase subunit alpha-1 like protein [Argiope bruennichi]|uniref:procollagen-proline 4-dioxygenase n=1 Tax=Argiope bruennichi TaxID=94029 RepID=A0A8T0FAR7_ARGBR|nr:Prolyl 4-hydroxylase subunit alpha-1 like protein [Argiope bruennichi]